jgi:FtsH-binding integral membrane protein
MLIAAYTGMAVLGTCMSIAVLTDHNNMMLIVTCVFSITFQLAPGPVTWLYVAESCDSKGVAAGTSVNLLFTLVIALLTNSFLSDLTKNYTFMMFGAFSLMGAFVMLVWGKETKGLSQKELTYLYRTNKEEKPVFSGFDHQIKTHDSESDMPDDI